MTKKTIIKIVLIVTGILVILAMIGFAVLVSLGLFVDKERAKVLESFRTLEQRQQQPGHEKDYTGLHPFVAASQRMKDASNEGLLKEKKIYEEVNASNIGEALAPENVTDATDLAANRQKIAHILDVINQFEEEQSKVDPLAILQKIMKEEYVPVMYQKIMMQIAEVDFPEMLAEQRARTELEKQYLLTLDAFLSFMQERHGTYSLRGTTIAFTKQSDIDTYNASMQKLEELNKQVATAWQKFSAEGDKYKEKLQEDLKKLEN